MYQSFIGLEIHIQLLTETKIFCDCKSQFSHDPNSNVCPVCLGYPGVLPALNKKAAKYSYMVARALNCELSKKAIFERKNYFYPDLPKNYQISQFRSPFGINGYYEFESGGEIKKVRIHDVHLEEDAGKMIHEGSQSFLDYNRAATCLLEIVTEPDLVTGEEAEDFLQSFRRMVRYLNVCDGNMEEGSLRCDANVSVNLKGKGLGKKVEIKNMNSSRNAKLALNYEIKRQTKAISAGQTIVQETRLWDDKRNMTESMRSKEQAHDYRYFPEPDLPPFVPQEDFLESVEKSMVTLPLQRKQELLSRYKLSEVQAQFLHEEKIRADFFEAAVKKGAVPDTAASWIMGDVAKNLNQQKLSLEESPLSLKRFSVLMQLLEEGTIHGKIAKQVLQLIFEEDKDPQEIIKEKGWDQAADSDELEKIIDQILENNVKVVEEIRGGNQKARGFLVGQVMKETKGTADPRTVQELLSVKL